MHGRSDLSRHSTVGSRTSRLAVISCALGVFCVIELLVVLAADLGDLGPLFSVLGIVGLMIAIVSGIVSFILIGAGAGRLGGRGFAVIGIGAPLALLVWGIIAVTFLPVRCTAFRMVCGTNLSGIGKAMLIYANDFRGEFPRAAGTNGRWTPTTPNWNARDRDAAYDLKPDGSVGRASITASLYLLIKYTDVTPDSFVCNKDDGTREFDPAEYRSGREPFELWDFGLRPQVHCSYAYHMPYGRYALKTSDNERLAVAADRNPFQPGPFHKAKDLSRFSFESRETVYRGNAYAHGNQGQNVLFLDSHVTFSQTPACGIDGDNIYTIQDGNDIKIGTAPTIGSHPAKKLDSLLVTDGAGSDAD